MSAFQILRSIHCFRTVRSDAARSNLRNLNLVKNILSSESSVYEGDTVELECRYSQ